MNSILPERLQNLFGLTPLMSYVFIGLIAFIILTGVFLKVNYFTAFLIFASSFVVSKATNVIANGSDLVLNLFLFLSFFLTARPGIKRFQQEQLVIQNFAFLVCVIQVVVIYLISGLDKLTSQAWRSGDAIFSIVNLEFFFNPLISVSLSETTCLLIAWIVILFELSFAILIWFKKTQDFLLAFGVLFHIGIAILLSLPDFGILMILLYSLFIQYPKKDNS
ncbi:MAG TPA: HTTM domain-containing protein [Cyclobacteriaceae bacterium]|nr:HTTM domain-containing protein [Cyclobacteriaceae bacterium]